MDKKKSDPSFSLIEFRSWLSKQRTPKSDEQRKSKSKTHKEMIGMTVESRLGIGRLEEKISEYNPTTEIADILAEDFKAHGGKIVSVNDQNLMVTLETSSGSFVLPKIYTKNIVEKG